MEWDGMGGMREIEYRAGFSLSSRFRKRTYVCSKLD